MATTFLSPTNITLPGDQGIDWDYSAEEYLFSVYSSGYLDGSPIYEVRCTINKGAISGLFTDLTFDDGNFGEWLVFVVTGGIEYASREEMAEYTLWSDLDEIVFYADTEAPVYPETSPLWFIARVIYTPVVSGLVWMDYVGCIEINS